MARGIPVIERKSLAGAQVVEDRVVVGFPGVLGNVDDGGDVTLPGAFVKTIQERTPRLRYLWMHDAKAPPIARILELAEVGPNELPAELKAAYPEATGALMVRREYLETPRAEEVLAGIRKGAINELSFAYDALSVAAPEDTLRWGKGARRLLKELRLWECSDVNWGMNPATTNLKALLTQLQLPEAGPERQKALAEWFEAQLHLRFTEMADNMFGDGMLTRAERLALSQVISAALNAFHDGISNSPLLDEVAERERFEKPAASAATTGPQIAGLMAAADEPAESKAETPEAALVTSAETAVVEQVVAQHAERWRRVLVARQSLALV